MLRGAAATPTPSPVPARQTARMENDAYAADGEPGRTAEYREPTMTFEPQEYHSPSTTPLRTPSRNSLAPHSIGSGHRSLWNVQNQLQHQRQQSAPDLQLPLSPSFSQPNSRPHSPNLGHARRQSQGMPLTGDGRGTRRSENSPGRFGGWLSATSTAADGRTSADTTPKSKLGMTSTTAADTTPKSSTSSRFGFFASSVSALTTRLTSQSAPSTPRDTDDELCNLDVEAALYLVPSNASSFSTSSGPTDRDAFSPAAYKNLQQNATGLLRRMQTAYRERTAALRMCEAEREAQREEAEEAALRVASLKSQLETMAARAAEQELAMRRLVAEVQAEREVVRRLTVEREQERERAKNRSQDRVGGEGPMIREDLCENENGGRNKYEDDGEDSDVRGEESESSDARDKSKHWRKSNGTMRSDLSSIGTTTTDGCDSAESESIFSRSRSPTATAMTSASGVGEAESEHTEQVLPAGGAAAASSIKSPPTAQSLFPPQTPKQNFPPLPKQQQQQQQLTPFQRLVKGISGGGDAAAGGGGATAPERCGNCGGRDASVAWDTVSLLRDENKGLKHRVAQLEVVVEGALDAVNGIGL